MRGRGAGPRRPASRACAPEGDCARVATEWTDVGAKVGSPARWSAASEAVVVLFLFVPFSRAYVRAGGSVQSVWGRPASPEEPGSCCAGRGLVGLGRGRPRQ